MAQSDTLEEVLISAYNNSELLKGSDYLLAIQDENIAQTTAKSRPSLTLNLGTTYQANNANNQQDNSLGGNIELLSEYALTDFGANDISVEIEKISKQVAALNRTQVEQMVLMGAVTPIKRSSKQIICLTLRGII